MPCSISIFLFSLLLAATVVDCGRRHEEDVIGFTAWTQDIQMYNDEEPVLFEGTNINQGDFYQPSTSRFLCPFTGVYLVTLNARRTELGVYIEILRGTSRIFRLADTDGDNDFNTVSNTALVQCSQGEIISAVGVGDGYEIYGEPGIMLSTFSVFLMSGTTGKHEKHNDTIIGVTSYLNFDLNYTAGNTLNFNYTILSSPHYDTSTGIFTCPVSGVYYINLNARKLRESPLNLGISLDSEVILHVKDTTGSNVNPWNVISNSRLVRCASQQQFMITALGIGQIDGTSARISTFTVMLVNEEVDTLHAEFLGFSAFKRSAQLYEVNDLIPFDGILLNDGNFDGVTYTCPKTGIYFASISLQRLFNQPLYLEVVASDIPLFRSEDTFAGNQNNTVSNSGLFACIAGEPVVVKAFEAGAVNGDPVHYYTTLSFMLLKEFQP